MSISTLTLIVYLVVLLPLMLLGFYFARRKMFDPHHKLTMTVVVIINWVLIAALMANSYAGVALGLPDNLSDVSALVPTIHGSVGLLAQLMATYLVLLMWTENTPLERLVIIRVKNIKTPMRITLSLWIITVLLGFSVYGIWNTGSADAEDAPLPAATEEAEGTEDANAQEAIPEPDTTEESE